MFLIPYHIFSASQYADVYLTLPSFWLATLSLVICCCALSPPFHPGQVCTFPTALIHIEHLCTCDQLVGTGKQANVDIHFCAVMPVKSIPVMVKGIESRVQISGKGGGSGMV